jgi:hypothetical protein
MVHVECCRVGPTDREKDRTVLTSPKKEVSRQHSTRPAVQYRRICSSTGDHICQQLTVVCYSCKQERRTADGIGLSRNHHRLIVYLLSLEFSTICTDRSQFFLERGIRSTVRQRATLCTWCDGFLDIEMNVL